MFQNIYKTEKSDFKKFLKNVFKLVLKSFLKNFFENVFKSLKKKSTKHKECAKHSAPNRFLPVDIPGRLCKFRNPSRKQCDPAHPNWFSAPPDCAQARPDYATAYKDCHRRTARPDCTPACSDFATACPDCAPARSHSVSASPDGPVLMCAWERSPDGRWTVAGSGRSADRQRHRQKKHLIKAAQFDRHDQMLRTVVQSQGGGLGGGALPLQPKTENPAKIKRFQNNFKSIIKSFTKFIIQGPTSWMPL